eukprot:TRINITY_DN127_c0_g1_i1.p1 TRINITY_DN127_c0_g1~~TRINITY_DN127_c0_g1_i1.p1  ORF type:complete len:998 (+),score=311.30 TRINITY_DN127_c0_g1_i1:1013-4006(+)
MSTDGMKVTPLMRFKITMQEPLGVVAKMKMRVGAQVGQASVEIEHNIIDLKHLTNFKVEADVYVYQKEIGAIMSRLQEVRNKANDIGRAMMRWRKGTVVKSLAARFAKMMGDVDFLVKELDALCNTGDTLSRDLIRHIIKNGESLVKLNKAIASKAMPLVKDSLQKKLDAPLLVDLLNRKPQPGDAPLELSIPKFLINKPFMTSALGKRIQDLILDAFVIKDITWAERMRYRQRKEEAEHGGAMKTLWQCAQQRCREANKGRDVSAMCNPDRLLDYRALRDLVYRSPRGGTQDRRICYNSGVIPRIIHAGDNKQPYCCRVIVSPSGSIKEVRTFKGGCTLNNCLQRSLPQGITDVQVTYGKSNKKEIQRARAPYKFVTFKGGSKPGDIGDDRWFGKATLLWYLFGHGGSYLNDVQIAWHDNNKERCPDGYRTVRKSWNNQEGAGLNQGWGTRKRGFKHVYLCLHYGRMSPQTIVGMELIYGRSRTSSNGFHIIRRSVSGKYSANFNFGRMKDEKHGVHLAIRRLTSMTDIPALIKETKRRAYAHHRHWSDPENKVRVPNGLPKLVSGDVALSTESDYLPDHDSAVDHMAGADEVELATGVGMDVYHQGVSAVQAAQQQDQFALPQQETESETGMSAADQEAEEAEEEQAALAAGADMGNDATVAPSSSSALTEDSSVLLADRSRSRATWGKKKKKKKPTPTPTPTPPQRIAQRYGDSDTGGRQPAPRREHNYVVSGWGIYVNVLRGEHMDGALGAKLLIYDFGGQKFMIRSSSLKYHDDIHSAITNADDKAKVPAGPGIMIDLAVSVEARTHLLLEGTGAFTGGLSRIISFFRGRQNDVELLAERFAGIQKNKILWRSKPSSPAVCKMGLLLKAALFYHQGQWRLKVLRMGFDDLHLLMGKDRLNLISNLTKWALDKFNLLPKLIEKSFINLNKNLGAMEGSGQEFLDLKGEGAKFEAQMRLSIPPRFFESKAVAALYALGKEIAEGSRGERYGVTE